MGYRNLKHKPGYVYTYVAKYKGKKFVVQQRPKSGNFKGMRLEVLNIMTIAIDINLSAREKQTVLHKLIKGKNVKKELHKCKGSVYIV